MSKELSTSSFLVGPPIVPMWAPTNFRTASYSVEQERSLANLVEKQPTIMGPWMAMLVCSVSMKTRPDRPWLTSPPRWYSIATLTAKPIHRVFRPLSVPFSGQALARVMPPTRALSL